MRKSSSVRSERINQAATGRNKRAKIMCREGRQPIRFGNRLHLPFMWALRAEAASRRGVVPGLVTFISYSRVFTCQLPDQLRRWCVFIFICPSGAWIFNKEADLICVKGTQKVANMSSLALALHLCTPQAVALAELRRKWFLIYENGPPTLPAPRLLGFTILFRDGGDPELFFSFRRNFQFASAQT